MMFDGLTNGLRWVFWGCVYLTVLITAALVIAALPLPGQVKIAMILVFVFGIVVDVKSKREPHAA